MSQGQPPPKVCQVLHSLHTGGAEVLACRLARRLSGRFDFLFACLDEKGSLGEEMEAEGFPVHVLGRRGGVDAGCIFRLGRLLRREGVDLVHPHQYTPLFYAMTARLLAALPGRRSPIVFTEHGRHQPDYPRRKRIFINRLLLRRRDRMVAVGEAVRRALVANEGMPEERVEVIYNGIDLSPFAGRVGSPAVWEEMGVGADDFVLIQVARLDYLKDHATAVRTLARVVKECPQAQLVLVGEGPEQPGIEALVGELGLGEHVRLLGSRRDVPRLLSVADAFLLTSISEGIPLTIAEAMAAGLPVVSTDVGGVGEMVEPEVTGLLAPAGDAEALAGQCLRLAGDTELRARLGKKGRERARERYDEGRMMEEYARVYAEVLGQ
jgi:glycosyltransferase involved in cell wall biosynthesis